MTDLDEAAIEKAARVVWDEYPEPLFHWDKLPETASSGPSLDAFRTIARAVVRTYMACRMIDQTTRAALQNDHAVSAYPRAMKETDRDGVTYCCDCGKVLKATNR